MVLGVHSYMGVDGLYGFSSCQNEWEDVVRRLKDVANNAAKCGNELMKSFLPWDGAITPVCVWLF